MPRERRESLSNRTARFFVALAIISLLPLAACDGGEEGDSSPGTATSGASGTGSASPTASAEAEGTYSGNGVSFRYPADWREFTVIDTTTSSGNQRWNTAFGIDRVNFVSVSSYLINIPITTDNIEGQEDSIRREIEKMFIRAGGSLESGPTDEEMAGLPALGFEGAALNPDGKTVNIRLVLAFRRALEYLVNCQYDSSGEDEILEGCDQIVSTFAVD
ncbi:MAG: hypothetical protein AB1551_07750 [Actinomycetota bacterium]